MVSTFSSWPMKEKNSYKVTTCFFENSYKLKRLFRGRHWNVCSVFLRCHWSFFFSSVHVIVGFQNHRRLSQPFLEPKPALSFLQRVTRRLFRIIVHLVSNLIEESRNFILFFSSKDRQLLWKPSVLIWENDRERCVMLWCCGALFFGFIVFCILWE